MKLREEIARKLFPEMFTRIRELEGVNAALLASDKVVVINPVAQIKGLKEGQNIAFCGTGTLQIRGPITLGTYSAEMGNTFFVSEKQINPTINSLEATP